MWIKDKLELPLDLKKVNALKAGDFVYLSGTLYTARDEAHKRLVQLLEEGKTLPFDLREQTIYYTGPAPPRPGQIINSAGPTTSGRMDPYTPILIEHGLRGMIGKGERNHKVAAAMKEFGAVYFAAVGGAAALISMSIKNVRVVAYEELGPEAIRELRVENFPVIVAQDCNGGNLYSL